jgi:peroxiredoxin
VSARKVDYSKFQELNVQILGLSASNLFSQRTFADSLALPYPLLSDYPDLKVIREYGVLQHYVLDPDRLRARRAFFLIDKQGIVQGKWLPDRQAALFESDPILQRAHEIAGN